MLLRCRGRPVARTASRVALFSDGAAKPPVTPRQRVRIDQEVSRRRTVAGACGPSDRSSPWLCNPTSTSDGIPCDSSFSRRIGSQSWWATNFSS